MIFYYKVPCIDCKASPALFMVHNDIWSKVGLEEKIICLDCFEKRLGRQVYILDLTPALGNYWLYKHYLNNETLALEFIDV